MTQKAYVGDNVARWVHSINVGVNGVARKVKKGYVGVNGVARQFWPYKNRAELSIPRGQKGIATVGNKVLIAGGSSRGNSSPELDNTSVGSTLYNTVDVFTLPNFTRSVTTLPYSLAYLTGTQNANYAYFVNGIYTNYGDPSSKLTNGIQGIDADTLRSNGCGQAFAFNSSLSRTSLNSPVITFFSKGCRFGNRAIFGGGLIRPTYEEWTGGGIREYWYRHRCTEDYYSINNSNTIEAAFYTGLGTNILVSGSYQSALTSTDDYIFIAFGILEGASPWIVNTGRSIAYSSTVHRFDSSFTKTSINISPNRRRASIANIGNNLVVLGGHKQAINAGTSNIVRDANYFDKNTMTVSTLLNLSNTFHTDNRGLTFGDHAVFANGGSSSVRSNAHIYDISLTKKDWPKYFGSLQYSANGTAIVSNGYLIAVSNNLRNPAIDIWDTSFNYCN